MKNLSVEQHRELALAAADSASNAVAELLSYVREERSLPEYFDTSAVEQLLDAAKLAIEVETAHFDDRGQVYAAICKYLDEHG